MKASIYLLLAIVFLLLAGCEKDVIDTVHPDFSNESQINFRASDCGDEIWTYNTFSPGEDVAVNGDDEVIVTMRTYQPSNQTEIYPTEKFDADGNSLGILNIAGLRQSFITVDKSTGDYYTSKGSNPQAGLTSHFNSDGVLQNSWIAGEGWGTKGLFFEQSTGLLWHMDNAKRIIKYNGAGVPQGPAVFLPTPPGLPYGPLYVDLHLDEINREIYVADIIFDQVHVYDYDFNYVRSIGAPCGYVPYCEPGKLERVYAVAVDGSRGLVYVSSTEWPYRLSIFTTTGEFIYSQDFGNWPLGIDILSNGDYVVSFNTSASFKKTVARFVGGDACLPSPEERLEDLIEEIENLLNAGDLNNGQANALISKLENVLDKLINGNENAVINQLNAFINQVNDYINSGILSPEQGQDLIGAANTIIDQI